MTKLANRKSRLIFETEDTVFERGRRRQVMVEAHPGYARVWLKGMKTSFTVSYGGIFHMAARIAVEKTRAEKKAKKKKLLKIS